MIRLQNEEIKSCEFVGDNEKHHKIQYEISFFFGEGRQSLKMKLIGEMTFIK